MSGSERLIKENTLPGDLSCTFTCSCLLWQADTACCWMMKSQKQPYLLHNPALIPKHSSLTNRSDAHVSAAGYCWCELSHRSWYVVWIYQHESLCWLNMKSFDNTLESQQHQMQGLICAEWLIRDLCVGAALSIVLKGSRDWSIDRLTDMSLSLVSFPAACHGCHTVIPRLPIVTAQTEGKQVDR